MSDQEPMQPRVSPEVIRERNKHADELVKELLAEPTQPMPYCNICQQYHYDTGSPCKPEPPRRERRCGEY